MKPSVAIALIACGTLSLITPAAYNFLLQYEVSNILIARHDMVNVSGGEVMSNAYQFLCWAFGAAMISVAVIQSIRFPNASVPQYATAV